MRPYRIHIGLYDKNDKYLSGIDFFDRPQLNWSDWWMVLAKQVYTFLDGYRKDREALIKQEEMF